MIPALLSIAAPVAIMIACGVLGGFFEGRADATQAIANKPIDHAFSAWSRVITAAFIAFQFVLWSHFDWWTIAPLTVIGLSAFNPVFRYTMNKKRKRKMDARYVSPSNVWDKAFIVVVFLVSQVTFAIKYGPKRYLNKYTLGDLRNALANHADIYNSKERRLILHWRARDGANRKTDFDVKDYRDAIHRAGRLAYIAELSCLITSALLYGTGVILSNN